MHSIRINKPFCYYYDQGSEMQTNVLRSIQRVFVFSPLLMVACATTQTNQTLANAVAEFDKAVQSAKAALEAEQKIATTRAPNRSN